MGYVLGEDGKRYYVDDKTGTRTLDNVSENEARAREIRNSRSGSYVSGVSKGSRTCTAPGSVLPVLLAILLIAAAAFVIYSGWSRTSAQEQAITEYMENRNASQTESEDNAGYEDDTDYEDESGYEDGIDL